MLSAVVSHSCYSGNTPSADPVTPPPVIGNGPVSPPVTGSALGGRFAGDGGVGHTHLSIYTGDIGNGVDVETLAYRVANRTVEEIRRRR